MCVQLAKMRAYQRYSTIFFTVGFLLGSTRRMVYRRRRAKLFALGSSRCVLKGVPSSHNGIGVILKPCRIEAKNRRRGLYSAKLFSVGIFVRLVRQKSMSRRAVALFAIGVFPMLHRVEGKPIG